MNVQHFYDARTGTISYIVWDAEAETAVVIDPVMDFDPPSGRVWFENAELMAAFIDERDLKVPFVLDTHAHADHMSALPWFKERYGAKTVIGAGVPRVQQTFCTLLNLGEVVPADGSQWDILIADNEELDLGPFTIKAIPTGGHTPASVSYLIGDCVFVGDTLFMPDSGAARCDFPGGSAAELYDSIQRIYALPPETRVFTLHDYQPGGRELAFESTVAEQRKHNIHIHEGVTKEEFVALRERLEVDKPVPRLLLPALQVNIRGGRLPEPESNGIAYLKLPLNAFGGGDKS